MTENTDQGTPLFSKEKEVYLKALSIRDFEDVNAIEREVSSGNIVVAKITPLAQKSLEEVKQAIDDLCVFVSNLGGDIARLGDERLVITPPNVKIWKEKED